MSCGVHPIRTSATHASDAAARRRSPSGGLLVGEESFAGLATQPAGHRQRAQQRRRPVALLAALLVQAVEHGQDVVEADLVGPARGSRGGNSGRGPSRRRRPRRCPRPRPRANAASLITWQTIRPSTSPGASATHAVCLPSVAKKRSAAVAADSARVGTSRQLDEARLRERRERVEADRAAARIEHRQRAGGAADRLRAALERRVGSSPRLTSTIRNGGLASCASSGRRHLPARRRPRRPRAHALARVAGDHDQAVAAAGGSGSGSARAVLTGPSE